MTVTLILATLSSLFLVIALASRNSLDQDVLERKYDSYLIGLALCGLIVALVRFVMSVV